MDDPVTGCSEDAHPVIITGDAITEMQKLPDQAYQLILSSPPYNIGKAYEKKTCLDTYLQWQTDVIREMVRLIPENGSIVWQTGNFVHKGEVYPLDIYFYPIFKSMGLQLRNRIVWQFGHGLHASKRFSGRYEVVLWFTKSDKYVFNLDAVRVPSKYPGKKHYKGKKKGQLSGNPLGKNPSDFWDMLSQEWESGVMHIPNVKANHPEKTAHPCQFPVELVERFILALTHSGQTVLDPFGGAGTTLIASLKNRRNAVIIERDATYVDIAQQRLTDWYSGRLKTRPMGQPIFKPV